MCGNLLPKITQWCCAHPARPRTYKTYQFELLFIKKNRSKGKGKAHLRTGHEGPQGKYRYSSTVSLTSALDGLGGQRHAPSALPPGKTQYPLYRRLGGPQGRSGRVRNISPPPGFDPRTVQPVASRYTDWAIPTHKKNLSTTYDKAVVNFMCLTEGLLVWSRDTSDRSLTKGRAIGAVARAPTYKGR